MIKGIGPSDTKIMVVADYATKKESNDEYALEGVTGRKINQLLTSQDSTLRTHLDECYKTIFYKDFLEGAEVKNKRRVNKLLKEALEVQEYRDILSEEIKAVHPNIIICLGELALNFLTGQHGIHKYRGSILPPNPHLTLPPNIKIVPSYHPRELYKQPELEILVNSDFEKALKRKYDSKPYKEDYLAWICKSYEGLKEFYKDACQKGIEYGVTDVETFLGFITYVGLSFDGKRAISIPLFDPTIQSLEKALIWKYLQKIFKEIEFVNQNIKFDDLQYTRWGFHLCKILGDTMLAGHTLYPELPKNLGFYTSIYTDLPYHKDEGKDYNPLSNPEQLGLYNAKDCIVTWRIYQEQIKELKERKLFFFYKNFVMPLFHFYRKVDRRGIRVDEEEKQKKIKKYNLLYNQHQELINNIAGEELNVFSYKQVGTFIYDELNCPKHTHFTPQNIEVYSTGEDVIEEIYINELEGDKTREYILKTLLAARKLRKIVQFLQDLKVSPDGRLRTTHRLEGTTNGRTSGSKTSDTFLYDDLAKNRKKEIVEVVRYGNYGYPFQTIGKHGFRVGDDIYGDDISDIFVPSPGYYFVEGDLGQAEARVVAVLSDDFETLDLMNKVSTKRNKYGLKDDMHTMTATWTTEKPFEEITELDRQDFGKKPRHAGNYDQTAFGLAVIIHKPRHVCEEILARFHDSVPKVRLIFQQSVRNAIDENRCLITPQGRRRDYFKRLSEKLYREAYAQIPQATVSDHMKWTGKLLEDKYEEVEVRVLAEKHDSLLSEVKEECLEDFQEEFKKLAERPISFREGTIKRDYDLVIPLEIGWSDERWQKKMKS